MIPKMTIIGGGWMGTSVARAVRARRLAGHIVLTDDDPQIRKTLAALRIADEVPADIPASVVGSDLVVVCVPLHAYRKLGERIGHLLKPGALVTDVGAVKQSVIQHLSPFIPASVHFVPAHPIVAAERHGPDAGGADLFDGRWCILTPPSAVSIRAVEAVSAFWESCGARIEILDPAHHDLVLAMTSHVPHLVAYTMVDAATHLEEDVRAEVIKYSSSGFRRFTDIIDPDPLLWRDIFLDNRKAILEMLKRFQQDLTALQKAIRRGDGDFLTETFARTQIIRRHIMGLAPPESPSQPGKTDAAA